MKKHDILEMISSEIRIYPQDTIPYDSFLLDESIKIFQSTFNITRQAIPIPIIDEASQKNMLFLHGNIYNSEKSIVILSIQFEDRKIVIQLKGDSEDTRFVFEKIFEYFKTITPGKNYDADSAIIKTYETKSIVKVDVAFDNFLSPKMNRFLKSIIRKEKNKISEISLGKLQFHVSFKQDQKLFDRSNIYLSSKQLIIEPRQGHHHSERIYFCSSPTDSKKHMEMLDDLDATFKK